MNQGSLVSTTKSAPSFPALAYQGTPVLTSEMLAQAYDVSTKQIRQNFNNNRERFVEGKHFFSLTGKELKEFKNCVDLIDTVKIPSRTPILTLWTDRGSARHAKMLESEKAWDVYELLEDTFFSVAQPALPSTVTPSTAADRRPLDKLVKVWAQQSGTAHAQAWTQVNAHFNLDSVAQLPIEWIPDAIAFVEEKINALATIEALPEAAQLPALSKKDLPSTARLFEDIRKAEKILEGTENWTHIKVRLELCREVDLYTFERSVDMHINAAWYALGLAKSSLLAALTVGRISKEFTPTGSARA